MIKYFLLLVCLEKSQVDGDLTIFGPKVDFRKNEARQRKKNFNDTKKR